MNSFVVIGCGSMGRRRIRDLTQLNAGKVWAFDPDASRLQEVQDKFGVETIGTFEEALQKDPDVFVVSVFPVLHAQYVKKAVETGKAVFCEAPLVIEMEDMNEIALKAPLTKSFVAPSCSLLHHPLTLKVKELLAQGAVGTPLAFYFHWGTHLATWRPGADYRKWYFCDRKNGGMGFDLLIHQFQVIRWLVGDVAEVSCFARRRSTVECRGGFDIYDILLDCRPGVSAIVHTDVFQRPPGIVCKAHGEQGTITWDWNKIEYYMESTQTWKTIPLPEGFVYETMYVDEIRHFLDALAGKCTYRHPLTAEKSILQAMLAAEESSAAGTKIALA